MKRIFMDICFADDFNICFVFLCVCVCVCVCVFERAQLHFVSTCFLNDDFQ